MEPARHPVPELDATPSPIVPEPEKGGSPEQVQAGAPGPSVAAFADDPAAPEQHATHGMGYIEGEHRYAMPAQSPTRAHAEMLPPSAESADAPGRMGLPSVVPLSAPTHRSKPLPQNPEPSEHMTPPVEDDRLLKPTK
jgi:hypothetical protein